MEKILRIVLPLVIVLLSYLVYESVAKPVREQKKIARMEARIIEKLELIKTAQMTYRDKHNLFANDFDILITALKDEKMPLIKVIGDPEDTLSTVVYDTSYIPLSEAAFGKTSVNLDSLPYVPFNPQGAKFLMAADTIEKNGVGGIPVFEVSDPKPYNKKRALKVGSLTEPVYTGNWE